MSPAPRAEQHVSPAQQSGDSPRQGFADRIVDHPAAVSARRLGHQLAGDSGDRLLARRVDVGHDGQIRRRECLPHLLMVLPGAGIEVGLEEGHEPPVGIGLARGGQRGLELGRVMGVVVHDGHAAEFAEPIEAPPDPAELRQRLERRLRMSSQSDHDTHSGGGVPEIVDSRDAETKRKFPAAGYRERGRCAFGSGVDGVEAQRRGIRTEPPDAVRGQSGRHPVGAGGVVPDQHALGAGREGHERPLQRIEGAVAFEVIGFDVVHHRDGWMEREKGLVVLIRFHDEQLITAEPRVAAPCVHSSAGQAGDGEPGRGDRFGGHGGGGGLPVGAGDGHTAGPADQARQRLFPRDDRDAPRPRRFDFDVPLGDGRAHHDRAGISDVRSLMCLGKTGRPARPDLRTPRGRYRTR